MGHQGAAGRAVAGVGIVLGVVLGLAACSGGADSESVPASRGQEEPAPGAAPPGAVAGAETDGDAAAERAAGVRDRPVVSTRAVIRRGEIRLVTKEMSRARVRVEELLDRHGGYLASEDTSNDARGRPERSVLVLRVPEPAFDEVMSELGRIGRTTRADRSSEDVTAQVVDVDARVATQEASVARLQGFLRKARTVEDIVRLESEIAERQADLESLKAQQKYLRDHTAMATVTVRLRTPATPVPSEPPQTGFWAGLGAGWDALTTLLTGVATAAGALLPFAGALSLVVVPGWLVARTIRRRRAAPTAAAPSSAEPVG